MLMRPQQISTNPEVDAQALAAINGAFDLLEAPPRVYASDFGWQNSWGDLNTGANRVHIIKDAAGTVHIEGVATRATTPAGASLMFTLRAGLRPRGVIRYLLSVSQIPILIAQVAIGVDGTVSMEACTGTPAPIFVNFACTFWGDN